MEEEKSKTKTTESIFSNNNTEEKNSETQKLLEELKDQRQKLYNMLDDLREMRSGIKVILPEDKRDVRYKKLFEEKLKTVTEFIKAELDIRKEISKSIKDESEIRRRNMLDEKDSGKSDGIIDIRRVAEEIERRMKS